MCARALWHAQAWTAGVLQHAQMRIPCDAGADDDGRRDAELLAREIDRLDGLDALQLVDGQGVAADAVAAERQVRHSPMSRGDTKRVRLTSGIGCCSA